MVLRRGPGALVYASSTAMPRASTRRPPLAIVLAVLLPVLLVAGLWLGGHPEHLPGFVRSAFVNEPPEPGRRRSARTDRPRLLPADPRLEAERRVDRRARSRASSDRFSHYLTPHEFREFNAPPHFAGIGVIVDSAEAAGC